MKRHSSSILHIEPPTKTNEAHLKVLYCERKMEPFQKLAEASNSLIGKILTKCRNLNKNKQQKTIIGLVE